MSGRPAIRAFFDEATNTFSYLVADPATRRAAVIDPVLDYDPKSGEVDIRSVDAILAAAARRGLTIEWSLETHAHADHLSGCALREGARPAPGSASARTSREVQTHLPAGVQRHRRSRRDGSEFDQLFEDGERFGIGAARGRGHLHAGPHARRASATGSAMRCSSAIPCSCRTTALRAPTSPAATRTSSIGSIRSLLRCRRRRACSCVTTTRRRARQLRLGDDSRRAAQQQRARSRGRRRGRVRRHAQRARRTLSAPTLLLPSIQVNIRAGRFPAAEANGVRYLKIPVKFKTDVRAAV